MERVEFFLLLGAQLRVRGKRRPGVVAQLHQVRPDFRHVHGFRDLRAAGVGGAVGRARAGREAGADWVNGGSCRAGDGTESAHE